MRADERELFFRAGAGHDFTKGGVEFSQIGKRAFCPGGFRNPRGLFEHRTDNANEYFFVQFIQRGE